MGAVTVRADSGLIVPASAVPVAERHDGRLDADGRRRVDCDKNERKQIRKAIDILKAKGVTVLLRCDDSPTRPTQKAGEPTPCGSLLRPEQGARPTDRGFGCACSRIHLS
jgi:hypothetical protein